MATLRYVSVPESADTSMTSVDSKMEVCDQAVQDLEFVSRIDKDLGPAASGFQDPVIAGCRFQGVRQLQWSNADHTFAIA